MARPRPIEQVDIDLSFRLHDHAGYCCFVVATQMRTDGTRSVIESRHLSMDSEPLIDAALALARQIALEEYLPLTSPF